MQHSTPPLPSRTKALASALLTTLLLSACGSSPQVSSMMQPASSSAPSARTFQAYDWDLTAAYQAQGAATTGWQLAGRPAARLHFEGDRLSVQNLCNRMSASYALNGQGLAVNRPVSTLRACTDHDLMELERRVAAQLPQTQRFELRDGPAAPMLVLHFADGSRWELTGAPTPATRYGSAGERVFLEVAPERVACNHPLKPGAQCLRVRDVRYADNGIQQGTGEWRILHDEIDGYRHEAGIRNVLRLQRYPLALTGQQPADAPSHAYVLDMVVESGRLR